MTMKGIVTKKIKKKWLFLIISLFFTMSSQAIGDNYGNNDVIIGIQPIQDTYPAENSPFGSLNSPMMTSDNDPGDRPDPGGGIGVTPIQEDYRIFAALVIIYSLITLYRTRLSHRRK